MWIGGGATSEIRQTHYASQQQYLEEGPYFFKVDVGLFSCLQASPAIDNSDD